jgi:transposase
MPAGRPSDYKEEFCQTVVECGKQGMSLVEIACELGVVRSTLQLWEANIPEFSVAMAKARELSQAWWEKTGRVGMIEEPGGVKLNASIYSRSMAARFPADWRENSKLEHTGKDGGPIETETVIRIVRPPAKDA